MLRKGLSCWHPCAHLLARLNERYRMTSSVLHSLLCSDQVAVPSDAQLHSSMASALPSFSASFTLDAISTPDGQRLRRLDSGAPRGACRCVGATVKV